MTNYRIHYRRDGASQDQSFDVIVEPPYPTINFGTTTTIRFRIPSDQEADPVNVGYGDDAYGDGQYGGTGNGLTAYDSYEEISAYQYRGSTALTQGGIISYSDPVNTNDPVDSNIIQVEPLLSGQSLPDFWAIVESTQNLTQLKENILVEFQLRPIATTAEFATRSALESSRKV